MDWLQDIIKMIREERKEQGKIAKLQAVIRDSAATIYEKETAARLIEVLRKRRNKKGS